MKTNPASISKQIDKVVVGQNLITKLGIKLNILFSQTATTSITNVAGKNTHPSHTMYSFLF